MRVEKEKIKLKDFSFISNLVTDYSENNHKLKSFVTDFPNEKSIIKKIKNRKFSSSLRSDLVKVLKKQYSNTFFYNSNLELVNKNINKISLTDTYTITTGHQLCLFSNPLFLIYKIIDVINLSKKISKISNKNIIPIFWLASEDHDFDEIKEFNLCENKYVWNKKTSNKQVGLIKTKQIKVFINNIFQSIEDGPNKKDLKKILTETYSKNVNLSFATRSLLTFFFAKHGLVVLDSNDSILKKHFKSIIKKDIIENISHKFVSSQTKKISKFYNPVVKPRNINFFYLKNEKRIRIFYDKNKYRLVDSSKSWTEKEIVNEIEINPEKFSPNVILRTLFQEKILPNIVYIGGPSEISYWLQFKTLFSNLKVSFPILINRSFILNIDRDHIKFLHKNRIKIIDLISPLDGFLYKSLYKKATINLNNEVSDFTKILKSIMRKSKKVDNSLDVHVLAQGKKIEKILLNVERKIIKNQKKNYVEFLKQLSNIHSHVYNNNIIQERRLTFLYYYLKYGNKFFDTLFKKLDCLEKEYIILKGL